jgi:hypothetical protein
MKNITLSKEQLKNILHAATGNVKDFVTDNDGFIKNYLKENSIAFELDYSKIEITEYSGGYRDADAYIVSATYDGVEMTDDEIDQISDSYLSEWLCDKQ